jgi:hypothetical protein
MAGAFNDETEFIMTQIQQYDSVRVVVRGSLQSSARQCLKAVFT